jgi:dihydrolipoamide dehydrogenase
MEHYDLCVIGGGPAGYAAAMRALDLGKRTLLIERDRIGGTGIYNGALASKTLWELSQRVASANEVVRQRGREPFRLSWEEISKTLNEALFERKYLFACHMQLLENAGGQFTHLRGHASFDGRHTVSIKRAGQKVQVSAEHFIIATGSRPRTVPNVQVDEQRILTSDGIFRIDDLPASIVIIGAGVIGCEFATIFSNFGRTKVHLIDRAERILPFEDPDVSQLVARNLERSGVTIHRNARLDRIEAMPHGVEYDLSYTDGRTERVCVEKALLSVGRIPNLEQLGLEHTGLALDPATHLLPVEDTRTQVPHVHVVGDASGSNMLVNLGEMEGRHAVERIFGLEPAALSYTNEQECRKRGIPHRVARIDYACLARAIAMRRTKGFFKVLVTDDTEMHILGMRAVGEHASSAIQAVALMMQQGIGIAALAKLVHPHPSITEGVQECARMLLGNSIFKSPVFGDKMQCYRWAPAPAAEQAA